MASMQIGMTNSCAAEVETDKTAETVEVSNSDFLSAVFGQALNDTRPIVVSFEGNPNETAKAAWFGSSWAPGGVETPANANNYFSLGVYRPDEAGRYRRRKADFVALYAIVLDDVGTKVPEDRIALAPSWKLETSPSNYQLGFLLSEPLHDGLLAERLMAAIINAKLCDPGANGPRARLARLPSGVNGKSSPAFSCRLLHWSPETRYSVDELSKNFQLELESKVRPVREQSSAPEGQTDAAEAVWIPRPSENTVLLRLRKRGLYKQPLGDAKHDITCPWAEEHSGAVDGGTAYFEPDDNWPLGGFKCFHGHCVSRHVRDLLVFLSIDPVSARMMPTIRVVEGELHQVVDAAERALAGASRFYQRGGNIVTVTTDPHTRDTRIQDVNQSGLAIALARAASWQRYDRRVGADRKVSHLWSDPLGLDQAGNRI